MQSYKISFKGQTIYVGIDVHLKTWHVTAVSESGYKSSFCLRSNAKVLFDTLTRKFPGARFKSAYEAGFCGFSVHYALTSLGIENIVVNAADIPTTNKEKVTKSDAVDSEKIAMSLRRGELTPIHIKDRAYMDDTNVVRLRQRFIKDLSRMKCRTKHLLYTQGVETPERFQRTGTHWSRNYMKWLREEVTLLSEGKEALLMLADEVDQMRSAVLKATHRLTEMSRTERYRENFGLLMSVPGIGRVTAMTMLTEIDNDPGRFSNERQFASFLGLVPTCHDSGDKTCPGRKTFRGNHQIGPMLVEASWIAIRHDAELACRYTDFCQRMKPQMAIIRIARKIACKAYAVMKNKTPYAKSDKDNNMEEA